MNEVNQTVPFWTGPADFIRNYDEVFEITAPDFATDIVKDSSISNLPNSTNISIPVCDYEKNFWCGKFGTQQIVEVIYLTIITVLGTIGNSLVIFSIILEKKVHKNGNIFIINLAIADLLITGFYTPTVIMNVVEGDNALSWLGCQVFGYFIIVTCSSSMWNLAFIAFNRYIAITKHELYRKLFSKKFTFFMVCLSWLYSILIASPTLYGWTELGYDYKTMVCTWNDMISVSFTWFLILTAVAFPLVATIFFYWQLFMTVRQRGRKSIRVLAPKTLQRNSMVKQKSLQREISLLKTLACAVVVFVLCWTPYCFSVVINPWTIHPFIKKICTWLGLNNSAVNFIIYGVMNQGYREGYVKLINFILCRSKEMVNKRRLSIYSITSAHAAAKKLSRSRASIRSSAAPSPVDKKKHFSWGDHRSHSASVGSNSSVSKWSHVRKAHSQSAKFRTRPQSLPEPFARIRSSSYSLTSPQKKEETKNCVLKDFESTYL